MRSASALLVLVALGAPLWAQVNDDKLVDEILAQRPALFGLSAWLVGRAADPLDLKTYAQVLVRALGLPSGLVYGWFPGPRYALRELVFRRIVAVGLMIAVRGWASWNLGRQSLVLVKANVTDAFVVGRTDFRDFEGALLNTKLDGVKGVFHTTVSGVDVDLRGGLGTSAWVFETGTRRPTSKPSPLFAPPRLVFYLEATTPRQDPTDTGAPGAPVSMGYAGVAGSGRITGPFYWSVAACLGLGSSLTPVGTYEPGITPTYPVWPPNLVVNALGSADPTFLQPAWAITLAGLGVQLGSWDEDGAYPQYDKDSGGSPSTETSKIDLKTLVVTTVTSAD